MARIDLQVEDDPNDPKQIIRHTISAMIRRRQVPTALMMLHNAGRILYELKAGYISEEEASQTIRAAAQAMVDAGELEAPHRGPCQLK